MVKFLVGLFIGGVIGFVAACILQANEMEDD